MQNREVEKFKAACREYLQKQSVHTLRIYGRRLELKNPSFHKKAPLIEDIIAVLCGEIKPSRDLKGAPIKFDYLAPEFLEHMDKLQSEFYEDIECPQKKQEIQEVEEIKETQKTQEAEPSKTIIVETKIQEVNNLKIVINVNDLTQEQKEKLSDFFKTFV